MNLPIPKPEDAESGGLQRFISSAVGSSLVWFGVLAAVEFDAPLLLEAHEIDDVAAQRHLTAKLLRQTACSHTAPLLLLFLGGTLAQGAGAADEVFVGGSVGQENAQDEKYDGYDTYQG